MQVINFNYLGCSISYKQKCVKINISFLNIVGLVNTVFKPLKSVQIRKYNFMGVKLSN
jgi:hypothetical protein